MVNQSRFFKVSFGFMGFLSLAILIRVVYLQFGLWPNDHNMPLTEQVHVEEIVIPMRGSLVDRHGLTLARSVNRWDLFVDPEFLRHKKVDQDTVVDFLEENCALNPEEMRQKLNRKKRFVVLKKDLTFDEAQAVKQAQIPGLKTFKNQKRTYPEGRRTAHVVGFVEASNSKGLDGLEYYHEERLKGEPGKITSRVDVSRRKRELSNFEEVPKQGQDQQLTLDVEIQRIVDQELKNAFDQWQPLSASAIVMDPLTGAIYAMSVFPNFDPQAIKKDEIKNLANRTISHCWEPGSILKPIIWAAALEEDVINLKDFIYCEPEGWKLPGRVLHDHKPHGWLSAPDILVKSSNVGMAKISKKLVDSGKNNQRLHSWLERFGLNQKTGVDLSGEISGILKPADKWGTSTWASIPMGHEIAVTPLQYLRAFNVFASGGLLVTPHVSYGMIQQPQRILSPEVSDQTAQALLEVVKRGSGKRAHVSGLEICGKTGTAQKLVKNTEGGRHKFIYSHEKYASSFAAFAPLVNPQLSVLVVLDEPHKAGVSEPFGSTVCAPVVGRIIERTLNYLEITPPIYKELSSP